MGRVAEDWNDLAPDGVHVNKETCVQCPTKGVTNLAILVIGLFAVHFTSKCVRVCTVAALT